MKSLGFIYLAKRPCGKVSALCWDDARYEQENLEFIERCTARGDTVERVERFDGDELPELICSPECVVCINENPQQEHTL